jgi:catechol 2,3-dioxygenase-like lactoylglutathione lyase family enzyme
VIVNLSDATVTRAMVFVDNVDRAIAFYRDAPGISVACAAPPVAPRDP